ncbi:GNAT family N-acetyltransferase [Streptomyces sp. RFCAC02]|uniref:GNAT family N-acetyltransferase n=1 Tax=Streptomyces sp. RFCAC02 TaxID=2499143 RepID=UPI0010229F46|nr:GNAT family N-acetyltransferase [Streptomyces sp. RFCAC02]
MTAVLSTPGVDELDDAVRALRGWQYDGAPMQLHPSDLGWYQRLGPAATAAAVRTWSRDGRILAVGLLDGPGLLRMTLAPDARRDEELSHRIAEDATDPTRGVLPGGEAAVEAPADALVQDLLARAGWGTGEPWTPLRRDLADPVQDPGVRIEVTGPERAGAWADVLRASFDGSTFAAERWHAMAAGSAYADARSLTAYDDRGNAVAVVTVWSAGPGRPGLIEPMGVHPDHRGHGHGRAVTLAAAAALREMGSSSVLVCTPSSNTGAVATYRSAGLRPLPEVRDRVMGVKVHG